MIKEKRSVFLFMNERILEQLKNVPSSNEDAYNELVGILESTYCELDKLLKMTDVFSYEEIERIKYELATIKQLGIAKVFVFGIYLYRLGAITTFGLSNYSYINYLLGVSTINSVLYNLPFERFFTEHRKYLPVFDIYVEKGKKGKLLKSLYERYGKALFIKGSDSDNVYFTSATPYSSSIIKESIIVAKENQEAYEENISILTNKELSKLDFYSFSITEVESIEYIDAEITEQAIFEKEKDLFACYRNDIEEFTLIEEVKPYLSYTENKLIYQEQFMEICNKVFGISFSMADYYRREFAKKKKENLKSLKEIIMQKFPKNGEKLFDYFYNVVPYSVSKAYLIACLQYKIEE